MSWFRGAAFKLRWWAFHWWADTQSDCQKCEGTGFTEFGHWTDYGMEYDEACCGTCDGHTHSGVRLPGWFVNDVIEERSDLYLM